MLIQVSPTLSKIETVNVANYLNNTLIEKIWYELDERVTREQIRQVAAEVSAQFQNATVATFIPIFIYRQTCEKLKTNFNEG